MEMKRVNVEIRSNRNSMHSFTGHWGCNTRSRICSNYPSLTNVKKKTLFFLKSVLSPPLIGMIIFFFWFDNSKPFVSFFVRSRHSFPNDNRFGAAGTMVQLISYSLPHNRDDDRSESWKYRKLSHKRKSFKNPVKSLFPALRSCPMPYLFMRNACIMNAFNSLLLEREREMKKKWFLSL